MIYNNEMYIEARIYISARHGEIVHFRRYNIDDTLDYILEELDKEMSNERIAKIHMDKNYG